MYWSKMWRLLFFCHFLLFPIILCLFLLHVPCVFSISLSMLVKTCVTAIQQLECSPLLYSENLTHPATRHIEAMACEEETLSGRSSFTTLKSFNNIKSHCVAHFSFWIGFGLVFQTVPWRLSLAIVDIHFSLTQNAFTRAMGGPNTMSMYATGCLGNLFLFN